MMIADTIANTCRPPMETDMKFEWLPEAVLAAALTVALLAQTPLFS
jgi:hypothetical protein